jgi:ribosomal protein L11 methyltransferase
VKRKPLWKISVVTTAEAEEAVGNLMQRLLAVPTSSYTELETGRVTVSQFVEKKPLWRELRSALAAELARIKASGLNPRPGRISLEIVRNWADSWKRHFQPVEISPALMIKPGWSRRRPKRGQAVVILDPGLSFGTGQHPTTAFCLRHIAARKPPGAFLDIGTGSGILAIAAARLGHSPVVAFDFDPEAVRVARTNARRNRVLDRIRLRRADLTKLRSAARYDLICANLISTLLVSERKRLRSLLKPAGALVVAGILKSEFAGVRKAFEAAGLKLTTAASGGEWRSGRFVLRSA